MRRLIRNFLQKFGYDIIKLRPKFNPSSIDKEKVIAEAGWLRNYGFNSIIDIGANEGQFSTKMRILFPEAAIYAFEPIKSVFNQLVENFSNDKNFAAFDVALGEQKGTIDFFENESSASSSVLEMEKNHTDHFDFTKNVSAISVNVEKLDDVFANQKINEPLLIKLDVQGYEKIVINGGMNTIRKAEMIIIELSFTELYKNQVLFDEMYFLLKSLGFKYMGNIEQLHSPIDNSILQADGIFIKSH
ncbi:MAG: FkbM family methyltransferase [Sphingobacteriales bacterium]|jgi:FkbM family methyltransferase|nr:FkbM family methyltransferase [Sphingobacteriales bacterium]